MSSEIIIIDDSSHYVYAIRRKLEQDCNCLVTATYLSGDSYLNTITYETPKPGLIILDFELPGISGLETFYRLRKIWNDLPVLFLSAYGFREYVEEVLKYPYTTYVSKQDTDTLCKVVKQIRQLGCTEITPVLSKVEKELLTLICDGLDNTHIARELNVSAETVKKRKHVLARKLNVRNDSSSFVKWALANNYYQLG